MDIEYTQLIEKEGWQHSQYNACLLISWLILNNTRNNRICLNEYEFKFISLFVFFPQECVNLLDLRRLVSISMDGPNVNFKCFELFQQEHAERYGGSQLVAVGSCGLHKLHNAVKVAFPYGKWKNC